nr:hypothetical protein [Tanacetum cinerariifolium]
MTILLSHHHIHHSSPSCLNSNPPISSSSCQINLFSRQPIIPFLPQLLQFQKNQYFINRSLFAYFLLLLSNHHQGGIAVRRTSLGILLRVAEDTPVRPRTS